MALGGMSRIDWVREQAFGRILDIGCNDGVLFNDTALAPAVMGVDLDEWKPRYGLGFKQADAAKLPFKDGEFHCAFLCEILEHVPDPVAVIKEARRVVIGCVFFTVPYEYNWDDKYHPCMSLEDKMRADNVSYEQLMKGNTTSRDGCVSAIDDKEKPHLWHIRYYTPDTLCQDIEKAGFKYKLELIQYDGWSFMVGVYK